MADAAPPSRLQEPGKGELGREQAKEILLLGLFLAVALGIPSIVDFCLGRFSPWARLLLPSCWLLATSAWWLRRRRLSFVLLRGGRRVWLGALLGLLSAGGVCAAAYWPASPNPPGLPLGQSLCIALLVPVAEELFFRGLLLDHLQRTLGWLAAVVGVSLLFGLLHSPQGTTRSMTLLSLVLCAITWHSRSLLWPMALHAAWNTASLQVHEPAAGRRLALGLGVASLLFATVARGLKTRQPRGAS